ncbi:hypothetical protein BH10PLA1_BH10PLA1_02990 [soil metagenome]
MKQTVKYGIYVAAGVGIFEILRRTGVLNRAGEWLQEQVPDDLKDRVRHMGDQVGEMVHDATDRLKSTVKSKAQEYTQAAADAAGAASSNGSGGEVITGGGEGIENRSEDSDGGSVPHHVGRGVVH